MKKIIMVSTLFLLVMLICPGCGEKNPLYQEVQDKLAQEDPANLKITIYYMDPNVQFRAYPSLEQLTDPGNASVTVYQLNGERTYPSVQVITNELKSYMIVPTEPAKHVNARLYYLLENNSGEKILELVLEGVDPECVYFNGTEVQYHEVFYRIIRPCMSEAIRGIKGRFY